MTATIIHTLSVCIRFFVELKYKSSIRLNFCVIDELELPESRVGEQTTIQNAVQCAIFLIRTVGFD